MDLLIGTFAATTGAYSGEEDEAETLEAVFAQARDAEATAEELLVDEGWKPLEVEPETIAVNSLPRTGYGGNGHHANAIGTTVELVPGNGANGNDHAPAPVNGNGHHDDEALEAQQSLFSGAEFMAEEPVKPKGRSRKPQPATLSMFEWALTLEQEREPVGAGHQAGRTKGRGRRNRGVLSLLSMCAGLFCCPSWAAAGLLGSGVLGRPVMPGSLDFGPYSSGFTRNRGRGVSPPPGWLYRPGT